MMWTCPSHLPCTISSFYSLFHSRLSILYNLFIIVSLSFALITCPTVSRYSCVPRPHAVHRRDPCERATIPVTGISRNMRALLVTAMISPSGTGHGSSMLRFHPMTCTLMYQRAGYFRGKADETWVRCSCSLGRRISLHI